MESAPAWSPDGTRIAFSRREADSYYYDIYVMDADGSDPVNLTNGAPPSDLTPTWSPDGTRIAFQSSRVAPYEIYVMNADGTGQVDLTNTSAKESWPVWSPR